MEKVKNKRFLITGCGRSGTGYYSTVLKNNGINCGHESYISGVKNNYNFTAESSWMAIPHLNKISDDVYVIRTIRNPIDVIKSFYDLGFFKKKKSKSNYVKCMINNIKEIDLVNKSDIHNLALYYLKWNTLFDNKIKNKKHETIVFEELLNKNSFQVNNVDLKLHKKVVNAKIKGHGSKVDDISREKVISELKRVKIYDELMEYYNRYSTIK